MSMSIDDFDNLASQSYEKAMNRGRRSGPCYNDPECAPLVWNDIFQREIACTGTVICGEVLRLGSTQNSLDIILVASHENQGAIVFPEASTVTVSLLASDKKDGTFVPMGPAVCVTAPEGGISADPDMLVWRVAITAVRKPYVKCKLVFSGKITGGTIDCALGYIPR